MKTTRTEGMLAAITMPSNETKAMNMDDSLWRHVGELASSSDFLMYLAEAGSDRMTMGQAAFFMLAATADAKGVPVTRSQLLAASGVELRPSLRNSYRTLLAPSRLYPHGLGWLDTEDNPEDEREQFLRLSDRGRAVIQGALLALFPMTGSYGDTLLNP